MPGNLPAGDSFRSVSSGHVPLVVQLPTSPNDIDFGRPIASQLRPLNVLLRLSSMRVRTASADPLIAIQAYASRVGTSVPQPPVGEDQIKNALLQGIPTPQDEQEQSTDSGRFQRI